MVEPALLVVVPVVEDQAGVVEQLFPKRRARSCPLRERDVLPQQMGPANLPLGHGPKVERLGAVTDQDAAQRSVEWAQRIFGTVGQDFEDRHAGSGERPQRHRDAGLGPARAIGVFDLGGAHAVPRFIDARLHGTADALLHGAQRAERYADPDDVREQLHRSAPAEMVDPGQ